MPNRFQLSRRKGYRKPPGAVVVSRPSKTDCNLGGMCWYVSDGRLTVPHLNDKTAAGAKAVELYRLHTGPMGNYEIDQEYLMVLRGHDLACWCPLDQPCHADVLLELANPPP